MGKRKTRNQESSIAKDGNKKKRSFKLPSKLEPIRDGNRNPTEKEFKLKHG